MENELKSFFDWIEQMKDIFGENVKFEIKDDKIIAKGRLPFIVGNKEETCKKEIF